jgi:hypothetical protein
MCPSEECRPLLCGLENGASIMAENTRQCKVVSVEVQGNVANVVVRIKGKLRNLTGDKENWSAMCDYPLQFSIRLEDLVERFAAERKIALARVLRNTSVDFIEDLNGATEPWTFDGLQKLAAPYQITEDKLDETIAKLEEKLAAAKAKRETI